ncbi:MmcQ/YjbR family DNA-binding protein [Glaciihabitans arcticus]|uniref:MmcQ/YjbR family DNA-binding protein n=1 Tax=Glaciihabitans arcticus TaxID=2668039 RepID=A0A4Q9GPU3_9MICO|nr:MmcQ/YjbR family DNA-binding protein [Glaciihabitans arcticus]TBN56635.1 MmcQ/YjbR family DNA-binding protein [Glaciihabitans arcticus]
MTPDELLEFCLALPQAVETYPFGEETTVFKTEGNGKIFALTSLAASPLSVSLKIDPADSLALQADYPAITPGYHLNKKHWVSVVLDGSVPTQLVEEMIRGSHALVRPRIPKAR